MLACSFLIESSSKLLVTKTGIKAWTSLISSWIRLLTLELLALEWRKFYTSELEYLWGQLAALEHLKNFSYRPIMGKWCLHASSFILDRIIFTVSGSHQDRHKSSVEFDFGWNQTAQYGVTCPRVTKISHFWTSISLKPVGQSWSNFVFSIIVVGERLHKVLGQIDLGTLDSGEWSLPFGLLIWIFTVILIFIDHSHLTVHFWFLIQLKCVMPPGYEDLTATKPKTMLTQQTVGPPQHITRTINQPPQTIIRTVPGNVQTAPRPTPQQINPPPPAQTFPPGPVVYTGQPPPNQPQVYFGQPPPAPVQQPYPYPPPQPPVQQPVQAQPSAPPHIQFVQSPPVPAQYPPPGPPFIAPPPHNPPPPPPLSGGPPYPVEDQIQITRTVGQQVIILLCDLSCCLLSFLHNYFIIWASNAHLMC